MTSRERVAAALSHREPDRVPIDLGSSAVTGIMVTTYAKLRERLG
ncbi:MAG: methyltransferase, partial [Armatimonadetes bacterium]|nr:methyltransferase [Armatimonadota bacterium]